jgi:hypothetical protein
MPKRSASAVSKALSHGRQAHLIWCCLPNPQHRCPQQLGTGQGPGLATAPNLGNPVFQQRVAVASPGSGRSQAYRSAEGRPAIHRRNFRFPRGFWQAKRCERGWPEAKMMHPGAPGRRGAQAVDRPAKPADGVLTFGCPRLVPFVLDLESFPFLFWPGVVSRDRKIGAKHRSSYSNGGTKTGSNFVRNRCQDFVEGTLCPLPK